MNNSLLNRAGINSASITNFLNSTFLAGQEWDHLAALGMGPDDVLEAPYQMILDNSLGAYFHFKEGWKVCADCCI